MWKRIAAIAFIYVCTSIGWAILGSTIFVRSQAFDSELRGRVVSLWGAPQEQAPPTAGWEEIRHERVAETRNGAEVVQDVEKKLWNALPLENSRIDVGLHLDNRQKGLLWYSTYRVGFAGTYAFRNWSDQPRPVFFTMNLPATQATYDDLVFAVDGEPLPLHTNHEGAYVVSATIPAHEVAVLDVAYRSQGLESWRYKFGDQVNQVRDFQLRVHTDFAGFDFPENTLSPSEKRRT